MRQTVASASFEHGDEAVTIGADAGDGIVDRGADAGLRREMHDPIGRSFIENVCHCGEIRKVDLVKAEAGKMLEPFEARPLERRVVVRRERIDTNDPLATGDQSLANVHSDKAGSAGHDHWPQTCHLVHSVKQCQTRT